MWKRISPLAMLFGVFPGVVPAAEPATYLCIPDKSTGFKLDTVSKQWEYARFKVEGQKYILSQKEGVWEWSTFGEKYGTRCEGINSMGYLFCDGFPSIVFNVETLRYQSYYRPGYVTPADIKDQPGNTPFIEIGRCSPL